jgi:hypothetical protein
VVIAIKSLSHPERMPGVVGLSYRLAAKKLTHDGLRFTTQTVPDQQGHRPLTVEKESPPAGANVNPRTPVTLWVYAAHGTAPTCTTPACTKTTPTHPSTTPTHPSTTPTHPSTTPTHLHADSPPDDADTAEDNGDTPADDADAPEHDADTPEHDTDAADIHTEVHDASVHGRPRRTRRRLGCAWPGGGRGGGRHRIDPGPACFQRPVYGGVDHPTPRAELRQA